MTRKDEFLLQLIDRVHVTNYSFYTTIYEMCVKEAAEFDSGFNEFLTPEIENKIKDISNSIGDLYQMIGNIR